ncbi:hypothetical protein [Pleionea litopenaei]|uniref:Uncharacterized protein n=1 Tax=Pleionea litopenaei TaxID=3070815 RepID=A0AA51X6Y6_9GAMM|nr:hypothetical protein [Pleionea sp. HL-JVS1]WMS87623.1 hypothetical protein Q9312_01550 [Pleionea sp. HL-JVS1]
MKYLVLAFVVLGLSSCDEASAEKFGFLMGLENALTERCAGNERCIRIIEEKIEKCMDASDWRRVLNDSENVEEIKRFYSSMNQCLEEGEDAPVFPAQ